MAERKYEALNRRLLSWKMRFGVPGLIGLAIFIFSVIFFFVTDAQQEREGQTLANLVTLGGASEEAAARDAVIGNFLKAFPPESATYGVFDKLYKNAANAGIVANKGNYKYSDINGTLFSKLQIEIATVGSYEKLRAFLAAIASAMPYVAIDKINFDRGQDPNGQMVQTTISMTVYLLRVSDSSGHV